MTPHNELLWKVYYAKKRLQDSLTNGTRLSDLKADMQTVLDFVEIELGYPSYGDGEPKWLRGMDKE